MVHYSEETETNENEETETDAVTNETGEDPQNCEPEKVESVTSDDKSGEIPKPGKKKEKNPKRYR